MKPTTKADIGGGEQYNLVRLIFLDLCVDICQIVVQMVREIWGNVWALC